MWSRSSRPIGASPVVADALGALLTRVDDKSISGSAAKQGFDAMWRGEGDSPDSLIEAMGLKQITDTGALGNMVDEVLANSPEQVQQFRDGKEKVIGFLVGQVMKASKGNADPAQVNALLREKLQKD